MLNFAVGPVPECNAVRAIASNQTPYFRTSAFSDLMLESERLLCALSHAPTGSRSVFLTSSGTGAMEAAIMGSLDPRMDNALVVDGGSFGHRFENMLSLHGIPHDTIRLEYGNALTQTDLEPYDGGGYTSFLVNLGETSQGILYDATLIGNFCARNQLFLIVDGISSFLADPFDMEDMGAGILITDSQKALACPPGIAPVVLAPSALQRINRIRQGCMYFDLEDALRNGRRGQTPFTPAVMTLLQLHERLTQIDQDGGAETEVGRCAKVATEFRQMVAESDLPLVMRLTSPSNAVTYLNTQGFSARFVFEVLQSEYGIWVCPNGGAEAESAFRVGHIGYHPSSDNRLLVAALCDLRRRGFMEET